jgi:tellurite resistance protein TerC
MEPSVTWWVGFGVVVLALLALDLVVLHKRRRKPAGMGEAVGWTVFWIALAVAFGAAIWLGGVGGYAPEARGRAGLEYYTAYLVELSLSLDNVFVFAVLFKYFKVDAAHQHGVLFWGILGAMVLRLVMIVGGLSLLQHFEWVLYVFGVVLLWSGWRMWGASEANVEPGKNPVLRWLHRFVPMSDKYDGTRFFTIQNGKRAATPLLAVLIALETTDIVFAVDSVPAVLAVTRDAFVAYTSNIFAILGLRSLYFLLAGAMERFWLLHYGLALLLGFIGVKMLLAHLYPIPTGVSFAVIFMLLGGSVAGSLLVKAPGDVKR